MLRSVFIVVLFLISSNEILAQTFEDTELWLNVGAKHKLNKKWTFNGEYQLRAEDNTRELHMHFAEIGVRRRFTKHLSLKGEYRYATIHEERNRERYALGIRYKWRIKSWKTDIAIRTKGQLKRVMVNHQLTVDWRNRLSVNKEIAENIFVGLSYESFARMYKYLSLFHIEQPKFSVNRYTLSVEYELKNIDVQVFYRIDDEVKSVPNSLTQIIGVGAEYGF